MASNPTRRQFLRSTGITVAGGTLFNLASSDGLAAEAKPVFKISLGEWSLHRCYLAAS